MANNRMYLRCKGCGEEFFIGKRFAGGYHIGQYDQYKGVPLVDRLNKFYADHVWCGNVGLDCFELIYEDQSEPHTADDMRPVVLCRDCDCWNDWDSSGRESLGNYVCSCAHWSVEDGPVLYTRPTDFCSYGEKREES